MLMPGLALASLPHLRWFSQHRLPLISRDREDAVKAYVVWQCSKVSSQEQKSSYDLAQSLTLDHGICLYMIYTNQRRYFQFYSEHGVLDGVAWHFVCDIKLFLKGA